jgi:hypothetical protein
MDSASGLLADAFLGAVNGRCGGAGEVTARRRRRRA